MFFAEHFVFWKGGLLKKEHTCIIYKIVFERVHTNNNMSSDENPVDIPLYWLVNRDPYSGLL